MALPSNSFMFNYNAKEYDAVTRTFPKTQGQLFDEDLVLNTNPTGVYEEYVDMTTTNPYYSKTYSSSSDNPFNRSSGNNSFTFIYKAASFSNNMVNIFANRNSTYNYMVRGNMFHTSQSGFLSLTPPTDIHICVIRIYNSGLSERFFVDSSGTVISSTSASTISWGGTNNGISFFTGYANSNTEPFHGKFYWMYCSLETLTDAEIQQVINYNEQLGSFDIEPENLSFDYSGGTSALTITAEDGWTASTNSNWLTLSSTAGTGNSSINILASANTGLQRTGTVSVTDGSDTLTCSITQKKYPIIMPIYNMFYNGNRIN